MFCLVLLLVAIGVGLYYGIVDRKKLSLQTYFYGDQNMSTVSDFLKFLITNN